LARGSARGRLGALAGVSLRPKLQRASAASPSLAHQPQAPWLWPQHTRFCRALHGKPAARPANRSKTPSAAGWPQHPQLDPKPWDLTTYPGPGDATLLRGRPAWGPATTPRCMQRRRAPFPGAECPPAAALGVPPERPLLHPRSLAGAVAGRVRGTRRPEHWTLFNLQTLPARHAPAGTQAEAAAPVPMLPRRCKTPPSHCGLPNHHAHSLHWRRSMWLMLCAW
jgi:hypothetical protein